MFMAVAIAQLAQAQQLHFHDPMETLDELPNPKLRQ